VSGDIGRKYDIAALRQAIKNIIYTSVGEKPFNPRWGSQIHRVLFEPMDDFSAKILEKLVIEAIELHEPRVKIETITVNPNYELNSFDLTIYFYGVGVNGLQQMQVVLDRLR
jgi:phage baseplate assembly protein W